MFFDRAYDRWGYGGSCDRINPIGYRPNSANAEVPNIVTVRRFGATADCSEDRKIICIRATMTAGGAQHCRKRTAIEAQRMAKARPAGASIAFGSTRCSLARLSLDGMSLPPEGELFRSRGVWGAGRTFIRARRDDSRTGVFVETVDRSDWPKLSADLHGGQSKHDVRHARWKFAHPQRPIFPFVITSPNRGNGIRVARRRWPCRPITDAGIAANQNIENGPGPTIWNRRHCGIAPSWQVTNMQITKRVCGRRGIDGSPKGRNETVPCG